MTKREWLAYRQLSLHVTIATENMSAAIDSLDRHDQYTRPVERIYVQLATLLEELQDRFSKES